MTQRPSSTSGPFVPVLAWPGRRPSYRELAAWHEALSASIANALPLDLLALWMHPARGGTVLIGPVGLSADHLEPPSAEPLISQEGIFRLEDRFRSAGYQSVMGVPIRDEVQDVGLLVVASLAADTYSLDDLRRVHRIAAALAASCRRLASHSWIVPAAEADEHTAIVATVAEGMLDAMDKARDGTELVQLTSDALANQLPHDRLELIAVAPAPECWALVGAPRAAAASHAPALAGGDAIDAIVHMLGARPVVRIDDLHAQEYRWPGVTDQRGAVRIRSVLAARLDVGGTMVGWLWFGSESAGWFTSDDEPVARLAARLIAPRIAAWTASAELAGVFG